MVTPDESKQVDTRTSKEKFLALPSDWPIYCGAVDIDSGLWAFCKLCDKQIPVRANRPFTIGTWNAHRQEVERTHKSKIAAEKGRNHAELRRKAMEGSITERELSRLKQDSKQQKTVISFFTNSTTKRNASGSVGNLETGATTTTTTPTTLCKKNRTSSSIIRTSSFKEDVPCQGIIQDFAGGIQSFIAAYCTYAAMNSDYTSTHWWFILCCVWTLCF